MKFKDFLILVPVGLALTACGSSQSGTDTTAAADGGSAGSPGAVTNQPVNNAPGGATGSTGGATGASGSSGSTTASGCPQFPQHGIYAYTGMTGTGGGRANYNGQNSTPSEVIADSKLRVSIIPGSANGTIGTGATANYTYMSADVHLLANGQEITKVTVANPGVQAPNGYTYPIGIQVGKASNPAYADFSNYIIGRSGQTFSFYVDNIKTDYKCNQFGTFAYYHSMGDCAYYYQPNTQYGLCSGAWNWDYHQWNWACCYTNMLEQTQELQCGVGTPLTNSTYSVSLQVETDSTPCITGF